MHIQVPKFSDVNVLVAGDVMLDRYWGGHTSRISPEAPVPVVRIADVEERPGGAGNVALNLAALGCHVHILGLIGNDEAGEKLREKLQAAKVNCHLRQLSGAPTITKLRVLSQHQQLLRLDFEEQAQAYEFGGMHKEFVACLEGIDVVILSDYGKGTLHCCSDLITEARARKIPVLVDPKGHQFSVYQGATLLTPNYKEFEMVVGPCADEAEIIGKGRQALADNDIDALLITRGDKGMTLIQQGQEEITIPTQAREVFDVTGAGDTVIAVLAAALATGQTPAEAAALANLAAGIVVGKLGAATTNVVELHRTLHANNGIARGIVSEEELQLIMRDARARGEKIVFTNGCFDILHMGHITYLEQAKSLGDRLVVAVNDDDSVRRLKGDERPLNALEPRMGLLSALKTVDWVVSFSEDTPERIICNLLPDILAKGGDYKPEELAGGDCVVKNGGEIKILPFVAGHSTTSLVEKIKNKQEVSE